MRYLFERLSGESHYGDTKSAVLAQLKRILVPAPGGDVDREPSIMDFGLPSAVEPEFSHREGLGGFARRIERLIRQFEPRLYEVRAEVTRTRDPLNPFHIVVTGRIRGEEEDEIRLPLDISGR